MLANVYFSLCVFLLTSPHIAQLFHFAVSVSFSIVVLVAVLCSVVPIVLSPSVCLLLILTACHSVAVDSFYPCLSFFVIAELAVVKTYHYNLLPLPSSLIHVRRTRLCLTDYIAIRSHVYTYRLM